MQRLRLYDCRTSRLPGLIGLCVGDQQAVSEAVNTAQRRLLMCKEASDDGWWGTWAEVAFNVSRCSPYITLPREIARLEWLNVCDRPVLIQNQFYEYLNFGNGRMPKHSQRCGGFNIMESYSRNNAVLFTDMTSSPQYITAYITDERDIGKRVLVGGLNSAGNIVTTTDVMTQVQGEFITLTQPLVTTTTLWNQVNGIQKDTTYGLVRFYQTDPDTGDEILLLTMEPSETTASYRRYYFHQLPRGCCPNPTSTDATSVQVTAIAKLDLIPVIADTDYCLIQSLEAIIEECQSVRYSQMDTPVAKAMSEERHKTAVKFLNGEINHYIGKNQVAVGVKPFGSAQLRRQAIGRLW